MGDSIDAAVMRFGPDPVAVTDRAGIILDVNPALERAFGWSRDELVGLEFTECFYPPSLRAPGKRALESIGPDDAATYHDVRHSGAYVDKSGDDVPITVLITVGRVDGKEVLLRYIRLDPPTVSIDAIARSERRFRKVMDASQELVSLVRPDGHWMFSTLGGPLGYPSGHMPPAGILSLVHPDDYEKAETALDVLAEADPRGGTAGSIVLRVRTIDGRYLWMENTGVNLLGDPDVGALVLQSRDITARLEAAREVAAANDRLEELTRQLRSVIEWFPAGVWLEDEHENLVMTNQTHAELFGVPLGPDELIGIDARALVTTERSVFADGDAALARRDAALAGGLPELDVEVQLANGRFLNRDYVPIFEGEEVRSHLWIYRDITERKELEFDQAKAHQQLEEQNQSLLELDRLKSELVATVSHELRTPLTSIISFAELLIDDPDMTASDRDQFTRIISNNANRLLVVVGDLLVLGRAEAGTLQIDPLPVDVSSIVDDAVAAFEPSAQAAGLVIETYHLPGPALVADPARLEQIVANLVTNAIKFTPSGGAVTVSSSFADHAWTIRVRDTGIGIPLDDQAMIFDRFVRASNATTTAGTGLGLAVVRSLVGLHRGRVELESEQGAGTTVTIQIPMTESTDR